MKEKFSVFGQNLTPERAEKADFDLDQIEREAHKPIEGEIEKNSEEIEFIKTVDRYLKEEFKEIGIEEDPNILPESIHLLSHEDFKKMHPDEKLSGFVSFPENNIYIDESVYSHRLQLYKTIFHESIHSVAFRKHHIEISEKRDVIKSYRKGYYVASPKESGHEHFRGLGEAIVDMTVMELFNKHKKEIIEKFKITPEEENLPVQFQDHYIEILKTIIEEIAKENNEDKHLVWQRFKRGQFTGEMMHLKDIDKVFGKGSLRVLAALDSGTKNLPEEEIYEKILRYFRTDDEKEKDNLAKKVLIEREGLRYKNFKERSKR